MCNNSANRFCGKHANKRAYFCMFRLPYSFVEDKKNESGTIITVTEHGSNSMLSNSEVSSEAAPERDNIHVVSNVMPSKDSSSG